MCVDGAAGVEQADEGAEPQEHGRGDGEAAGDAVVVEGALEARAEVVLSHVPGLSGGEGFKQDGVEGGQGGQEALEVGGCDAEGGPGLGESVGEGVGGCSGGIDGGVEGVEEGGVEFEGLAEVEEGEAVEGVGVADSEEVAGVEIGEQEAAVEGEVEPGAGEVLDGAAGVVGVGVKEGVKEGWAVEEGGGEDAGGGEVGQGQGAGAGEVEQEVMGAGEGFGFEVEAGLAEDGQAEVSEVGCEVLGGVSLPVGEDGEEEGGEAVEVVEVGLDGAVEVGVDDLDGERGGVVGVLCGVDLGDGAGGEASLQDEGSGAVAELFVEDGAHEVVVEGAAVGEQGGEGAEVPGVLHRQVLADLLRYALELGEQLDGGGGGERGAGASAEATEGDAGGEQTEP